MKKLKLIKRPIYLLSAIATAGSLLFSVSLAHAAASASMYLSPGSTHVTKGQYVSIGVYENSGAEPVNAVQANLSYSSSILSYVSISSSSAFGINAQSTGGGGSVKIGRGANPAVSGVRLVASVRFKAVAAGTASVNFAGGSAVLSANSNTDISSSKTGGSYAVKNPSIGGGGGGSSGSAGAGGIVRRSTPTSSSTPSSPRHLSKTKTAKHAKKSTKKSEELRINNVKVGSVSYAFAVITWTTSAPATSDIKYGTNIHYGLTYNSRKLVASHKAILKNLAPGGQYHFIVSGHNATGHKAASKDQTFATKGATIIATVLDQNGDPVSGAKVSFSSVTGAEPVTGITNDKGQVTLVGLTIGKISGTATYKGEKTPIQAEVKPIDSKGRPVNSNGQFQKVSLKIKTSDDINLLIIILPIIVILVIAAVFIKRFVSARANKDLAAKAVPLTPKISGNSTQAAFSTHPTVIHPNQPTTDGLDHKNQDEKHV